MVPRTPANDVVTVVEVGTASATAPDDMTPAARTATNDLATHFFELFKDSPEG